MSGAEAPASPVIPGLFVAQGLAIEQRLKGSFPPGKFHFKILPPRITRSNWSKLQQGNMPFIGLGFNGFQTKSDNPKLGGFTSWTVLLAVRMDNATDKSRYYGDVQGIGALTMAAVAAPLLHNFNAATGSTQVRAVTNVVAEDWGDDCVIMKIDLVVPVQLPLRDAIRAPDGLGWLQEMESTWTWATQDGSQGTYTSDWESTNETA